MQAFRNCYQKNKRNAGSQELEDSEHAKKWNRLGHAWFFI
jgi:hypothetical protein